MNLIVQPHTAVLLQEVGTIHWPSQGMHCTCIKNGANYIIMLLRKIGILVAAFTTTKLKSADLQYVLIQITKFNNCDVSIFLAIII